MVLAPRLHVLLQGNFNGTLQSTYNPAWHGVTSLNCNLPVPYINSGPASLSNRTSGSFSYTPVDGGALCTLLSLLA